MQCLIHCFKCASLPLHTDGHKMVLVEGIPTVFSWEQIYQFTGEDWIEAEDLELPDSRSAFAITTIPGHLIRTCV